MLAKWIAVLPVLAWCSFIAGTSNTVVRPHDFFAWLASHVFTDRVSFHRFAIFWGYSWFLIVKGWHLAEFAILCSLILILLNRVARSTPNRNVLISVLLLRHLLPLTSTIKLIYQGVVAHGLTSASIVSVFSSLA